MPTTEKRQERKSPKRDLLMDTAWRLFYRDGYRAVGIDTVLAEAGVAKMTLYNHFASKDELIVALLEQESATVLENLQQAAEGGGRSASRRLLGVFDGLEKFCGRPDFRGCAFIRALSEFPDVEHPVHQAAWRHKEALTAFLRGLA